MPDGWAGWDQPREPRSRLDPTGAQQVRYCPRCADSKLFEPVGDDARLACLGCGYQASDKLTDSELLRMVDRFGLPLPSQESRVVV